MGEVRVGIIGVGNCANSFMQGLYAYSGNAAPEVGLVRPAVGPYRVADIKVVAAFDVIEGKVGKDFSEAMWAFPNDTYRFADVPYQGVDVSCGRTLDGLGQYLRKWVSPVGLADEISMEAVVAALRAAAVDVVINYLPVGSEHAARFYAQAALAAGCAFVNCMPTFIASNAEWSDKFKAARLPIIGDDIKSQVGATIVHRVLASLFKDRGVHLDRTLQLNIGGNGDFLNMLERERLASKKISKTNAVVSVAGVNFEDKDVHIGPSDYVQWLGDRKWAYIRLEGRGFGGAPLNLELKLEVWDSPNSAGIVIDAVRCAKLALDRGDCGVVLQPSAYFMKSPPVQVKDAVALQELEDYLAGSSKAA